MQDPLNRRRLRVFFKDDYPHPDGCRGCRNGSRHVYQQRPFKAEFSALKTSSYNITISRTGTASRAVAMRFAVSQIQVTEVTGYHH